MFDAGKNREIIDLYMASPSTFSNKELEIVAAAYDGLGRLADEDKVLYRILSRPPLFGTYSIPSDYLYYGNFISGGFMEDYKDSITSAYLRSIKDTASGRAILNAFYRDQIVRTKYDYNKYCSKNGIRIKWDSMGLVRQCRRIDSANALLIAGIISDYKGFPSKAAIGLIGTWSLFIMMQHLDVKYRDRYDKFLFEAACRREISMDDYAMYKTRTLVANHQIPDARMQHTLDSLSEIKCR